MISTSALSRPARLVAAATMVAAVALLPSGTGTARGGSGTEGAGGRAVAHRAGGHRTLASRAPEARLYRVGRPALEPTLGVTNEGHIFIVATGRSPDMMRSTDGGATWEFVSPNLAGNNLHSITLDPYMWLDEATGRIYTIDLTVACSYLSYSDDDGATWVTNPLACGVPVNDHQTLFGGPAVSSPTVYESILYYCYNGLAVTNCTKSLDGGITWAQTGEVVHNRLVPDEGDPQNCRHSLNGHGVVGADGTVYLPREACEEPWLWISEDEGLTWQGVKVARHNLQHFGMDPNVAVDDKGNLYYVYVTKTDGLAYLVTSKDGGNSWSKPLMFAAPGLTETEMPAIDVGAVGKIAIAYYGTADAPGKFPERGAAEYQGVGWNGYITMTTQALTKDPIFYSASINDPADPLVRGMCSIARNRCRPVYDFIDLVIGSDGTPYGSFVDGCLAECVTGTTNGGNEGFVGRLVGGPSLR